MQAVAFALQQVGRDVTDVLAFIAVGRKGKALAAGLEVTQPDAGGQDVHLPAGIVDVVLAVHLPAIGGQQIRHAGAERTVTPVTHVQRPGRVGRHELDDDLAIGAAGVTAEGIAQLVHLPHHLRLRIASQIKIDEAGAGDFAAQHARRGGQLLDDGLRQRTRRKTSCFGQTHGDIAGEVAVGAVACAFDDNGARIDRVGQQRAGQTGQRDRQQLL